MDISRWRRCGLGIGKEEKENKLVSEVIMEWLNGMR
jgi:hypothetical protein